MPSKFAGHTPGPWRVGDAGMTVFGPPQGLPPLILASRGKHTPKVNMELMAAAPDLLAACEAMRGALIFVADMKLDATTAREVESALALADRVLNGGAK